MSEPMALEQTPPVPFRHRITARFAVALAWPISKLSPRRIERLLLLARRGAGAADPALASLARQSVVAVSAHCAGQGCLRRSIAAALFCRLHHRWPTWRLGVRTAPFRAHAWIEAHNHPVNEPFPLSYFTPLITVPPA